MSPGSWPSKTKRTPTFLLRERRAGVARWPAPLATARTPAGCVELLQRYDIPWQGQGFGESNVVGAVAAAAAVRRDGDALPLGVETYWISREADVVIAGWETGGRARPG